MSKRDDIRRIWTECFADTRQYVEMYFSQIYRDDEAMLLTDPQGNAVSSLMLQKYAMSFHSSDVPVSYIAGAATRRAHRGKGYMGQLMEMALRESAERGDMLVALIPASEALYIFYRRWGFSTVFYTKEQRFTSFHPFTVEGNYHPFREEEDPAVWCAFDRLQRRRNCYILHSERDFYNILSDLRTDGGDFVVMARDDEDSGPQIVSMAWAVTKPGTDILCVTDVMGFNEDARIAALRQLRCLHGQMPVLLFGHPSDSMGGRLMPRGMGRVVCAKTALDAIAASAPEFNCRLRITDPLLPDINSHTYIVGKGICGIDDTYTGHLDFDVDITVFTDILFSAPPTGDILRFPSVRPMLSLMLD